MLNKDKESPSSIITPELINKMLEYDIKSIDDTIDNIKKYRNTVIDEYAKILFKNAKDNNYKLSDNDLEKIAKYISTHKADKELYEQIQNHIDARKDNSNAQ